MNGRIYDPLLGRMLSADLVVQNPLSLQHYNRYSYVQNNPLTLVDPTGWYSVLGLEFTDGGGVGGFFKDLGGYTADAGSGAGHGLYNATVGGAISAGNEAGQIYIDARESGSGGAASFGYATSMGLGRMSGGMGLVEFYSGSKVETGSDGSLKQGEFGSVSEWAVHGAASYAQAGTTAIGIKTLAARVGAMAPKTGAAPEVSPEPATAGPCFAAGTLVLTPDGLVPIEKLKAGDTVVAYDFETGELAERSVLQTFENRTEYWMFVRVGDEEIQATRTHPFWVESEGDWINAIDLKPGMVIRLADGRLAPIASTRLVHIDRDESTFNLCVQKDHDYFVGVAGVLVHNGVDDDKLHGNDPMSKRPQHRYVINDDKIKLPNGKSDAVKTGIGNNNRLNQNGTSGRANQQVNKLNKEAGETRYSAEVKEPQIEGRQKALESEAKAAKDLKAEGNSMRLHQRPKC